MVFMGLSGSMGMEMAGAETLSVQNCEACIADHVVPALLVALGEDSIVLGDPLQHGREEAWDGNGSHHQFGTKPEGTERQ